MRKYLTVKQIRELPPVGKVIIIPYWLIENRMYDDVIVPVNSDHTKPKTGDFITDPPVGAECWSY